MIEEIVKKYGNFSDALISEIQYRSLGRDRIVEIVITCMNSQKDYDWDTIRIKCSEINFFRFEEKCNVSSTAINSALVFVRDGLITVDFFPTFLGGEDLEENPKSDFIIKFEKISYELISN